MIILHFSWHTSCSCFLKGRHLTGCHNLRTISTIPTVCSAKQCIPLIMQLLCLDVIFHQKLPQHFSISNKRALCLPSPLSNWHEMGVSLLQRTCSTAGSSHSPFYWNQIAKENITFGCWLVLQIVFATGHNTCKFIAYFDKYFEPYMQSISRHNII